MKFHLSLLAGLLLLASSLSTHAQMYAVQVSGAVFQTSNSSVIPVGTPAIMGYKIDYSAPLFLNTFFGGVSADAVTDLTLILFAGGEPYVFTSPTALPIIASDGFAILGYPSEGFPEGGLPSISLGIGVPQTNYLDFESYVGLPLSTLMHQTLIDPDGNGIGLLGPAELGGEGGFIFQITDVQMTLIPEPSTYALLGGLMVLGVCFIRRRKR